LLFNLTTNLLTFNGKHDCMSHKSAETNRRIQTISKEVFMVVQIYTVTFWIMTVF
jgi:hypothetical protein